MRKTDAKAVADKERGKLEKDHAGLDLEDRAEIRKRIDSFDVGDRYLNRELSWLQFNMRVLSEAENPRHPLLERLRFLSISGNNLDEFYMVRVAGLKGQRDLDMEVISDDGLTPQQQLDKIAVLADRLMDKQQEIWVDIVERLADAGLQVIKSCGLSGEEKDWLKSYYVRNILPVLTPIAVDPAHPFPFIPNLGFTLALMLKEKATKSERMALIPVPHHIDRFIRLPGDATRYIAIENVLSLFHEDLFPDHRVVGSGAFRVIRDSDLEVQEEAEDLVRLYESALKRRRRGRIIRLKMDEAMPARLQRQVIARMGASEDTVKRVGGILGINETEQLITDDFPELKFTPYNPRYPERVRDFGGDIFKAIAAKDFVVHHPYESFEVVHKFLRQAARDPDVVAIKQTLYRAGSQSQIIHALIEAAEAGKSVTAVVELRARFDEEQNIKWARDLENAGVHVVFGVMQMKTHAKVSMVVRREADSLRTYMHFGTGNYHPITARIYTDLSFFTIDPALGRDAARMFNFLTGYVEPAGVEKIALSPFNLRSRIVALIDKEIEHARAGRKGAIWIKANALLDAEIIDKLYEASCNGVEIDCIVRGICTLRPGIKGLSENIRVKSIVGRFLEHSRIYCFGDGHGLPSHKAKLFISSADWMPRNFNRRVEVMVPIENKTVHKQIMGQVLAANMKDDGQSWIMNPNGSYQRVDPVSSDSSFIAHDYFMNNPSLSGRGTALEVGRPAEPIIEY